MGLFSEHFSSDKEFIVSYSKKLGLQNSAASVSTDQSGDTLPVLKQIYEIPKKGRLTKAISQIADDNLRDLRESLRIEEKLSKVHEMVVNFDKITHVPKMDDFKWRVVESESILSINKRVSGSQDDEVTKSPANADDAPKNASKSAMKKSQSAKVFPPIKPDNLDSRDSSKTLVKTNQKQKPLNSLRTLSKTSIRPPPPSPCSSAHTLVQAKKKCKKVQANVSIPVINLRLD